MENKVSLNEPFLEINGEVHGSSTTEDNVPCFRSQRWLLAIIGFFGFFFVYALRVNMSVAMVCMVRTPNITTNLDDQNVTGSIECVDEPKLNLIINEHAEFDWDKTLRSSMLASFFYGYIVTQIPGGWIADRFGGKRVFGVAMLISSIVTILLPVCARASFIMVFVLRIILGLTTGVAFPAVHSMWGRWAPPLERSKLTAVTYSAEKGVLDRNEKSNYKRKKETPSTKQKTKGVGTEPGGAYSSGAPGLTSISEVHVLLNFAILTSIGFTLTEYRFGTMFGNIVTFASSGLLCQYGFDNGWGSIFYITGGLTLIWVVIWFVFTSDSPNDNKRITKEEKRYIQSAIEYNTNVRTSTVPWRQMFTSRALLACLTAHVCSNWTNYTLLTSLPVFMKEVLKFDIKQNGAMSAVPYVCKIISGYVAGISADVIRSKKILTTTNTRKCYQVISFTGMATCLIIVGYSSCDTRVMAMVFLSLAVMSLGACKAGYSVNHIDFAPKYSGILFGITNTAATIPGMIAPIVAGALTPNKSNEEWRTVFFLCAAISVFGAIIFGLFAKGEIEPWARDKIQDEQVISVQLATKEERTDQI